MTVNMGIESKQRQEIQRIFENVASITTSLRTDLPQVTTRVKNVLGNADTLLSKAQGSLDSLNTSLDHIKTVTGDIAINSKSWNEKISKILDRADNAVSKLENLVETQQQNVKDSLANIKTATTDAKDLMAGLKNNTLDELNTAMTSVKQTAENLKSSSAKIRDFVAGAKPVLEHTLAKAQISAEQLNLATVEIRRSPWRLLHSPSEDELETDNLYDAARSFALAAGALQTASASLDAVVAQNNTDPKQVQAMVEHLGTIFEKFKSTEKIFWDTLGKYNKTKPAK